MVPTASCSQDHEVTLCILELKSFGGVLLMPTVLLGPVTQPCSGSHFWKPTSSALPMPLQFFWESPREHFSPSFSRILAIRKQDKINNFLWLIRLCIVQSLLPRPAVPLAGTSQSSQCPCHRHMLLCFPASPLPLCCLVHVCVAFADCSGEIRQMFMSTTTLNARYL